MAMVSFPRNITTMRLPTRFFCPLPQHNLPRRIPWPALEPFLNPD